MGKERWRPVPGWEHYDVSDFGRVRRNNKIMSPAQDRGWRHIALSKDGKRRTRRIHRLVAAAFIGPCPTGHVVYHKDGNRGNNRRRNLEYITGAESKRRAVKRGLIRRGADHGRAKLQEADVRLIRQLAATGETNGAIAARYGVDQTTVSLIVRGQRWKHVA